jgi:hypothetical protein
MDGGSEREEEKEVGNEEIKVTRVGRGLNK